MEFFHKKTNFDFMGWSNPTTVLSLVLFTLSISVFLIRGLNLGIDFTGGVLVEVGFAESADLEQVRSQLEAAGHSGAQVQHVGSSREVLIRLPPRESGAESSQLGQKIIDVLQKSDSSVSLRRIEFVGPQVGEDLTEGGILALLLCLVLIGIYIMFRFQWKFAAGALVGVIHDPIITLGVFAAFGIHFDLSVIAAVLAITGYSLNDTIVIFDRMRENFRKARGETVPQIMNRSINETLSRTIMTHVTTSMVIIALLVYGGEALRSFSIALAVGMVICTYSSIYCAGSTALYLKVTPADFMPPKQDKDEVDAMP
jgi:preprotein translocase subunit SecF